MAVLVHTVGMKLRKNSAPGFNKKLQLVSFKNNVLQEQESFQS